ncbi:MAG: SIS domain-containing protein, partial [Actinomycetota bacterium]
TLHLFDEARERGARLVVLTSGGALEGRARAAGATLVKLPNSLQPRAALGYLTIPILLICERLGLGPEIGRSMPAALEQLERRAVEYGRSSPSPQNDAKRLALSLAGRLPWVYGSEGMSEVAAYRWKCQMNECAKVPCSSSFFPELTHNEVVGWSGLSALTRKHAALIVLRHNGETVAMARRMDATVRMIRNSFGFNAEIRAEGPSELARFLDLTYLGDFTSTYLGIAGGVDPAPVEPIDRLKEELKTPQRIVLDGGLGPAPGGVADDLGPDDLPDEMQDEVVRVLDAGSI